MSSSFSTASWNSTYSSESKVDEARKISCKGKKGFQKKGGENLYLVYIYSCPYIRCYVLTWYKCAIPASFKFNKKFKMLSKPPKEDVISFVLTLRKQSKWRLFHFLLSEENMTREGDEYVIF